MGNIQFDLVLGAIGLGIGLLAAVISFLIPVFTASSPPVQERPKLAAGRTLALALMLVLFILAMLKEAPFSPGQQLGWGLLIGGMAALLSASLLARLGKPQNAYLPYPDTLVLSLVLAAMSLTFLLFRGNPVDALMGCALGVVLVAGIFRVLSKAECASAEGSSPEPAFLDLPRLLEAGAIFSVTLASASALAVYHFNKADLRGWWAFPLALAGFWLLGRIIAFIAALQQPVAKYPSLLLLTSAVLAAAFAIVPSILLSARMETGLSSPIPLGNLIPAGLITAALLAWLILSHRSTEQSWPAALQVLSLAVLLVVFLTALTFRMEAGFGVGIALLAAWSIAGSLLGLKHPLSNLPVQALAVGAGFLLLRLFLERIGATTGEADMSLHYTLIGLTLGALLPFVYASFSLKSGTGRALFLGALGGLSPLALLTLWGPDTLVGLLAGLMVAQALQVMLTPIRQISAMGATWQAPIALLALGMGLVAVQFSRAFAFLYELTRAQKSYVAAVIALLAVLWIISLGLAQLRKNMRAGNGLSAK
jgi:hypothetical protein